MTASTIPTKPAHISTVVWNTGAIVASIFAGRREVSSEELERLIFSTYATQPRAKRNMPLGSYLGVSSVLDRLGMTVNWHPITYDVASYNFAGVK